MMVRKNGRHGGIFHRNLATSLDFGSVTIGTARGGHLPGKRVNSPVRRGKYLGRRGSVAILKSHLASSVFGVSFEDLDLHHHLRGYQGGRCGVGDL